MIRNLIAAIAFFCGAAAAVESAPAVGDGVVVTMKGGREISGVLLKQDAQIVSLVVDSGEIGVERALIEEISREQNDEGEFRKRRSALAKNDVAGHWALALWAKSRGLTNSAKSEAQYVVTLSSTHFQARSMLGYVRVNGEWMTRAETIEQAGFADDGREPVLSMQWPIKKDTDEFNARKAKLEKTDVSGYWELAQWAKEKKRSDLAASAAETVLRLDPLHTGARRMLERELFSSPWREPEEMKRAKERALVVLEFAEPAPDAPDEPELPCKPEEPPAPVKDLSSIKTGSGIVVTLNEGREISGVFLGRKDGLLTVGIDQGEVALAPSTITSVKAKSNDTVEFAARRKKLSRIDAAGHWRLAKWAKSRGLDSSALAEAATVLEADPNHAGAHRMLGQRLHKGRWLTYAEVMKSMDYVEYDGEWIAREDFLKLESRRIELEGAARLQAERNAARWLRSRARSNDEQDHDEERRHRGREVIIRKR